MKKEFIYIKSEFLKGFRRILVESNELSKIDFLVFPFLFVSSFFLKTRWISFLVGIIGFIGVTALFFSYILTPRRFYKDNKYYQGDYYVEFSPEDFYLQNLNTVIEEKWEDFQKILVDDDFLYLYLEESALFVPLRIFSEDELKELNNILKDWRTE